MECEVLGNNHSFLLNFYIYSNVSLWWYTNYWYHLTTAISTATQNLHHQLPLKYVRTYTHRYTYEKTVKTIFLEFLLLLPMPSTWFGVRLVYKVHSKRTTNTRYHLETPLHTHFFLQSCEYIHCMYVSTYSWAVLMQYLKWFCCLFYCCCCVRITYCRNYYLLQ